MNPSEKIKCKHHLGRLAHWTCDKCMKHYCHECIDVMDHAGYSGMDTLYLCSGCRNEARWIGAENTVVPYWKRFNKFFTFPLNLNVLLFLIVLSVINTLLSNIFFGMLNFFTYCIFLNYALKVLESTGQGSLKPPPLDFSDIISDIAGAFKLILIFFLLWFVIPVYMSSKTDATVILFYILLIVLISPSLVMSYAATKGVGQTLNPLVFGRIIYKIGWSYGVLFFLIIMFLFAENYLLSYLSNYLPAGVFLFIRNIVSCYYTLAIFHLMGYFLLQFSKEIGYDISFENFYDPKQEDLKSSKRDPELQVIDQVNTFIKDGEIENAISYVSEWVDENGIKNLHLSEKYYNLLKMKKMRSRLLKHAHSYLKLLIEKKDKKSIDVFKECFAVEKNFQPEPDTLFGLADLMNGAGLVKESLKIYSLFIKRYPDDKLVAESYFKSAQIYNDRLFKTEKAIQILNYIQKKYPDSDIIPKTRNYLKTI